VFGVLTVPPPIFFFFFFFFQNRNISSLFIMKRDLLTCRPSQRSSLISLVESVDFLQSVFTGLLYLEEDVDVAHIRCLPALHLIYSQDGDTRLYNNSVATGTAEATLQNQRVQK